jgi:hypothetical protein
MADVEDDAASSVGSVFMWSHGQRREERYDEGENLTHRQLMQLAENKYRLMVDQGEWNKPTAQDRQIQALTSQIEHLQKKAVASAPPKSATKPKTDTKGDSKPKTTTAKQGSSSKKSSKDFAWKKVAPKEGEAKTKTVDGKKYHWCPNHKAWTIHSPSECHGVADSKEYKLKQAASSIAKMHAEDSDDE